jgi:hypothetical protein
MRIKERSTTMDEAKPKKTLKNDEATLLALEHIASNTACVREAVGVAAKIGAAWIKFICVIALGVAIPMINPYDKTAPIICYGAIVVFGLYAVVFSLVLLSDLKHSVEDISEKAEKKPFWKYF